MTLCDCILDLTQNSIEAGAQRVFLSLEETETDLFVRIQDNGKGMSPEVLKKARDPFYTDGIKHKHRKVGLGIPFLMQTVEMTDGDFQISSEEGRGTELSIRFNLANIDTPPLGDIVSLFYQALSADGEYEMEICRSLEREKKKDSYEILRTEIQDVLGSLNEAGSLNLLRQYIGSQEEDLLKGD